MLPYIPTSLLIDTRPKTSNSTIPLSQSLNKIPSISNRILDFGRFLRANAYPANPSSIRDALQVAATHSLHDHYLLQAGFRACFCKTPEQWRNFDKLFVVFWSGQITFDESESHSDVRGKVTESSHQQRMVGLAGTSSEKQQEVNVYGSGDFTALSLADFRFVFNPHEKKLIDQYVDELGQRCRRRYIKKTRLSNSGSRVAIQQSIKQSLRYQGAVFQLRFHVKKKRLPSFVLLLDISQSMDVYARLFLRFTRKLLTVFESSHAFAFNIELINLGKGFYSLEESDFEHTINTASQGWVGGTRIAKSFQTFNESHLNTLVKSQTTVLVFSDGCDTDKPEVLAEQVNIMSRRARRVIWVNPLLGRFPEGHPDPRMDPVRPYITHYLSAHNLPSLLKLQRVLLS